MIISIPIASIGNYKIKAKKAIKLNINCLGRLAGFHDAAFPEGLEDVIFIASRNNKFDRGLLVAFYLVINANKGAKAGAFAIQLYTVHAFSMGA